MTWLDNVYEQHRSSDMRVRSLKVGERDFWCVKGAKEWLSYDTELNCLPLFNKLQNYFIYPVFIPEIFLWSPAHIVLQVSKAFVDFFFISSYSMYRNVVFIVLLMLPRSCFLFHKTVLNECVILIRGKFTMKIRPKYILRKGIHRFIQIAQILYGSRKRGMGKYGPSKYQSERSDLPQDYLAIRYSSIVVPIYDMRYWPNLFGQDDWILAEFFFFSRFYGLGRSRGP